MRGDRRGGRTAQVPRESLIGAHRERREAEADQPSDDDTSAEPVGAGADVAPTARAEERERARHHLQRAEGIVPAGDDNPRQRRAPRASRERLDAAARSADESVTGRPPHR
jgi:hypothetical protein